MILLFSLNFAEHVLSTYLDRILAFVRIICRTNLLPISERAATTMHRKRLLEYTGGWKDQFVSGKGYDA